MLGVFSFLLWSKIDIIRNSIVYLSRERLGVEESYLHLYS